MIVSLIIRLPTPQGREIEGAFLNLKWNIFSSYVSWHVPKNDSFLHECCRILKESFGRFSFGHIICWSNEKQSLIKINATYKRPAPSEINLELIPSV
ncbi:MAG TPA: hypothetical protein DCX10_03450 [Verrucomicrobiales bacterium]|nr:hypothetical protein [Verrucomicrobiales bacterium]